MCFSLLCRLLALLRCRFYGLRSFLCDFRFRFCFIGPCSSKASLKCWTGWGLVRRKPWKQQPARHYRATLACPLATHVRKRLNLLRSRARLLELGFVLFCLLNEYKLESGLETARARLYFGQGLLNGLLSDYGFVDTSETHFAIADFETSSSPAIARTVIPCALISRALVCLSSMAGRPPRFPLALCSSLNRWSLASISKWFHVQRATLFAI